MGMTRKRLNLIVAVVEGRMPTSAKRRAILSVYAEAFDLLHDWEGGVPLDERVQALDRCLRILEQAAASCSNICNRGTSLSVWSRARR
jgi:hypothetical protein